VRHVVFRLEKDRYALPLAAIRAACRPVIAWASETYGGQSKTATSPSIRARTCGYRQSVADANRYQAPSRSTTNGAS
jgi:hypothetical protein